MLEIKIRKNGAVVITKTTNQPSPDNNTVTLKDGAQANQLAAGTAVQQTVGIHDVFYPFVDRLEIERENKFYKNACVVFPSFHGDLDISKMAPQCDCVVIFGNDLNNILANGTDIHVWGKAVNIFDSKGTWMEISGLVENDVHCTIFHGNKKFVHGRVFENQ